MSLLRARSLEAAPVPLGSGAMVRGEKGHVGGVTLPRPCTGDFCW